MTDDERLTSYLTDYLSLAENYRSAQTVQQGLSYPSIPHPSRGIDAYKEYLVEVRAADDLSNRSRQKISSLEDQMAVLANQILSLLPSLHWVPVRLSDRTYAVRKYKSDTLQVVDLSCDQILSGQILGPE